MDDDNSKVSLKDTIISKDAVSDDNVFDVVVLPDRNDPVIIPNDYIITSQESTLINDEELQAGYDSSMESEDDYSPPELSALNKEQNDIINTTLTSELVCKLKPNRRSSNMKTLLKEQFTQAKDKKRPGFYTDEPLIWYDAMREYSTENDIANRCEIIRSKNSKVTRCVIHICYNSTKRSSITINFVTGIIRVQGASSKDWVDNEFLKVQRYVPDRAIEKLKESEETPEPNPTITKAIVVNDIPPSKNNKETKKNPYATSRETETTRDDDSNIEKLWEECTIIKNSVKNLHAELISLSKGNNEIISLLKKQKEGFSSELLALKTVYDQKLTVFMSATSIDCTDENKVSMNTVNGDLSEHKKNHNRIESIVQKCTNRGDEFMTKQNTIEATPPEWKDLQTAKETTQQSLQTLNSSIEILQYRINTFETKMESMKFFPPNTKTDNNIQLLQHNVTLLKTINNTTNKLNYQIEAQLRKNTKTINKSELEINQFERELSVLRSDITSFGKINAHPIPNPNLFISTYSNSCTNTTVHFNGDLQDDRVNDPTSHQAVQKSAKLLICMDSNRRFLDPDKLWRMNGTEWRECANLRDIKRVIINEEFNGLEAILIHCGVNDIDYKDGNEVFEEIKNVINLIHSKYPTAKIILSEITPRTDDRDIEGIKCNQRLETCTKSDNTILVKHQNLRDERLTMWQEVMHIKKLSIPKFAVNLKVALRAAFNIPTSSPRNINYNDSKNMSDRNIPPRHLNREAQKDVTNNDDQTHLQNRLQRMVDYKLASERNVYDEAKKAVIDKLIKALCDI